MTAPKPSPKLKALLGQHEMVEEAVALLAQARAEGVAEGERREREACAALLEKVDPRDTLTRDVVQWMTAFAKRIRARATSPRAPAAPVPTTRLPCTTPNGRTDCHLGYVSRNADGSFSCAHCGLPEVAPAAPAAQPETPESIADRLHDELGLASADVDAFDRIRGALVEMRDVTLAAQPEQTAREAALEKAMRGVLRSIIQFVIDKDGSWVAIRTPAIENLRLVLAAGQEKKP